MRRWRYSTTLALAAAGVLAVSVSVAMAGVASDGNDSSVEVGVTPSLLPKTTFKNIKLFTHTHTDYGNPASPRGGGGFVHSTTLLYDDDIKLDPSATPKCNSSTFQGNTPR